MIHDNEKKQLLFHIATTICLSCEGGSRAGTRAIVAGHMADKAGEEMATWAGGTMVEDGKIKETGIA